MGKGPVFWIVFSGITWFVVGVSLLLFGIKLIVLSAAPGVVPPALLSKLALITQNGQHAVLILVMSGLMIGFVKGRFILSKTARRVASRIHSLPHPIKISQVYSLRYIALIACMILLGMSMKWLAIPIDIRGAVDVAIGFALMNGAMFYFRSLLTRVG